MMTIQAKIRRERETLFLSSLAVIFFFVWGSAKVLFSYILDPVSWLQMVTGSENPAISEVGATVIIAAYILVNFLFRLCIGLPAIKDARADSSGKRIVYLVLAIICLVMEVLTFQSAVIVPIQGGNIEKLIQSGEIIGPLAMFTIEVTSCLVLIQLLISSLKLKYLRHAAKAAGPEV